MYACTLVVAALLATSAPVTPVASLATATSLSSWRTFEGDDPQFARPDFDDAAWATTAVVGKTARAFVGGPVWFRTTLELTPTAQAEAAAGAPVALTLPLLIGAHQLYVDGTLIEDVGSSDRDFLLSHEAPSKTFGLVHPRATLALRVLSPPLAPLIDNLANPATVVLGPPAVVALTSDVLRATNGEHGSGMRFVGLFYAGVALYHLLLWRRRRSLVAYGWYSLFAIGMAVQVWTAVAAGSGALGMHATFGLLIAVPPVARVCAILMMFPLIDATRIGPRLRALVVAACALNLVNAGLTFFGLASAAVSVALFVLVFVLIVIAFGATAVWKVALPALRGNTDARILAVGFAVMVFAGVVRGLMMSGVLSYFRVLDLDPVVIGAVFLVLVMGWTLGRSYTHSLNDLDKKNRDLVDVNLSMARFLPDAFLALLSRGSVRDVVRGDNTELEITVLFSDIRGFTTISERIGTRGVFQLINRYLEFVEPTIHDNHGFISQYYGDGVMALFATTVDDAVRCTVEMHRAVERFNAQSDEQLTIGVGLNTGTLMLGTIGGKDRLACNVIGDPVNLAARIEGMTKLYGARVLISDVTAAKLTSSGPRVRRLDRVVAKGKTLPMTLFEVIDADPPALRDAKVASREKFERGLDDLAAARFDEAQRAFSEIAQQCPLDTAAAALALRAQTLATEGVPAGWDGAVRLVDK